MSEPNTHLKIDPRLCGHPVELSEGRAVVEFEATEEMAVDAQGLVHGGFVFGLADYAAMLAVNDPYVVLGAAETRFVAPVAVGDTVVAQAEVIEAKGKKRVVKASARVKEREVLSATFTAFVLEQHVLEQA